MAQRAGGDIHFASDPFPVHLETPRLRLRPYVPADAPALFELARDPRVGPAAGWAPHRGVDESREIIRTVLAAPETYALVLREPVAGRPAGSLAGAISLMGPGASDLAGEAELELGYWIGRPFWGHGLATEAAALLVGRARRVLGARCVWCASYAGNWGSRRVQDKVGFVCRRVDRAVEVPRLGERRDLVVARIDFDDAPSDAHGAVSGVASVDARCAAPAAASGDGLAASPGVTGLPAYYPSCTAARAIDLLAAEPDSDRYLCVRGALRLGRSQLRFFNSELGVLTQVECDGCYYAAPFSREGARAMREVVVPGASVNVCDVAFARDLAGDAETHRYDFFVYRGAYPVDGGGSRLFIVPLTEDDLPVVREAYGLLDEDVILRHLCDGRVWGGYDARGDLVGFIGEHDEGSMGMLEVFPAYRRRGYARALEAALMNALHAAGRTPYCHVDPANRASIALQRTLGLTRVGSTQCWLESQGA